MRHGWLLPLAVSVALGGAIQAEPPAAPADAEAVAALDAKWEGRLIEAQMRRDEARQQVSDGQAAVNKARHREYPRGDALVALRNELEQARKQLAAAEDELPELLEEARLAGVSPAVLQRFEPDGPDEPDEAPSD